MSFAIYTHNDCLLHDTGADCYENPKRLEAIHALLKTAPFSDIEIRTPDEVKPEWLHRAHRPYFTEALKAALPKEGRILLNDDTPVVAATWRAAMLAAGAVCEAVQDVASGKSQRVFCAIRPPGHHAGAARSEGYCIFNNVVIGALHAQAISDMKRIAIIDFDVHQGNGSDALAREHQGLFYVSSHQWPIYPTMGLPAENKENVVLNMTFTAGDGSEKFRKMYSEQVFPALDAFKPDLIMISAGFDAHKDDPLAEVKLDEADYSWITTELRKIADKHAKGRIVSTLEGGYNVDALVRSVAAHVTALR